MEIFENGKYNYVLTDIGCDICGTEYDAAHVQWGDAWRMPEAEEFKELLACCQADFGHYLNLQYCGLSLCGPNGNSIFLPINVYDNNDCSFAILTGNYWSGSLAEDNPNVNGALAVSLYFSNSTPKSLHNLRYMGQSIRPVVNRKIVGAAVDSYTETAMEISYADGMLFVNGLCDSCEAAVVDVSGRLIAKSQLLGGRCELPDLRGGIYVVSVLKSGSVIATRKIVVK